MSRAKICLQFKTPLEEVGNIFWVFDKGLYDIISLRTIFTQDNNLDPAELLGKEATKIKTPPENGKILPLVTQQPSHYTPLVDAPEATYSPPPGSLEDTSDADRPASDRNLPRNHFTDFNKKLFGVYHDWVQKNNSTYLYGRIE